MTRAPRRALAGAFCLALAGCSDLVQYAQDLGDKRTGRTALVCMPAQAAGFVGFGIGFPICVVLLPASWVVYEVHASNDPAAADAISTLFWPSFVLWRVGNLVAAPLDLLEWVTYRAWRDPQALTASEREELEAEIDAQALPSYPVQPLYPIPVHPTPTSPKAPRRG